MLRFKLIHGNSGAQEESVHQISALRIMLIPKSKYFYHILGCLQMPGMENVDIIPEIENIYDHFRDKMVLRSRIWCDKLTFQSVLVTVCEKGVL